jgi:Zn finger protein HypA/HybF involved in hydrogenase expression
MAMYKCGDCAFWGEYEELIVEREVDMEPYGDRSVERESIYWICPECESEDITEWVEAG